ncbi:renin receptor [Trichoplusia ni]|uniref:Renin receptor n=1 Tax=Trichoplusia ni TaxID=7111 RepID=A0A7E5VSQ5_TRINI|nr:renin receptor [Trichoplusia ni]
MAVTMALFWVSLVLSVIGANAAGEFTILHSPPSLKFTGTSKTLESLLKEIFSASLGLSVEENSEWKGLYVADPFKTPEAVVEVYIDGVSSLGDSVTSKAKTYSVDVDEYEPDTFDCVKFRIQQRSTSGSNKILKVKLSDPTELTSPAFREEFGEVQVPKVSKQNLLHLKYSLEEDYQFLSELATLKAITDRVASGAISADNIIDFFNFRFTTLHALSDYHGPNSLQTKEAKKLLGHALQDLSKAFVKAYDGSVLVTAVTTDVAHTRRAIRSTEDETKKGEDDDSYSADYPAIFNIILWFGVVFAFSLIAIVYAIMDMDPGRDSIIYRMTSTRMKKEN